jgi:hypothetical protein
MLTHGGSVPQPCGHFFRALVSTKYVSSPWSRHAW